MIDDRERKKQEKKDQLIEDYLLLSTRYEELSEAMGWDCLDMEGFPKADRKAYEKVLTCAMDLMDALEELADEAEVVL